MKKIHITAILIVLIAATSMSSCGSKQRPNPTYMPDMAYSRAYETYEMYDTALITSDPFRRGGNFIFYNSMPVTGTIKRGELYPYTLPNDSNGYKMSSTIQNPYPDTLDAVTLAEAGRLYNIHCGICHGEKGGANGPLATTGKIGGVANIATGEKSMLSDGTMFHVMTYGKGIMGSYASQLSRSQRWQIVKYIRTLQSGQAKSGGADSTGTKKGTTDTTSVASTGTR